MKFRKAIIFLLCAVMSLSMLACGSIDMPDSGTGNPNGPNLPVATHTIIFDINAPAGTNLQSPAPIQVTDGQTMGAKCPAPTCPGWTFQGWYDNNTLYTKDTPITGDLILTAKWSSAAEENEKAKAYENAISSWAQPGHLYIHYKRAAHPSIVSTEQGTPPTTGKGTGAPLYNSASNSTVYGDWGLWCWPQNGEGRTFNLAWIDESGAVYDVDLTHTYGDAGWDGKTVPGKPLNNTMNYEYQTLPTIGMQLFKISSRQKQGYWQNDGGNNYITYAEAKRAGGDYHWFVSESKVGQGTPRYTAEEIEDVYGKIPAGSATTSTSPSQDKYIINSNNANPTAYPKWTQGVKNFDANTGYQIFIASFCDSDNDGYGDIKGIISQLDYLKSLNIDMLWLTPFQTSTNYHGYDIDDFFSVNPRWGTKQDYRDLVDGAHSRGMKIVMDLVLNHTSEANEWFVKSKNLVKETNVKFANTTFDTVNYRNFYSWINETQYNKLTSETKKQWYGDEHGYYFYSSFGSSMPELNYDYQPVRDAIVDVCYQWMEYGLDGFRLDAVKHIYMVNEVTGKGGAVTNTEWNSNNPATPGKLVDTAAPLYSHDQVRNVNFYREFNHKLKTKYPNAFVVGENLDGYNLRQTPYYQGIDSQFEFNVYYASRGFACIRGLTGGFNESSMGLAFNDTYTRGYEAFTKVNSKYIGGQFTSNHDLPRARNRMALSKTNGSTDDSYAAITGSLINDSYYALFLYYGMIFTLPGVTWLYYGDEIGMDGIMQYTLNTGSTDSLTSEPHEDRVYRQPMKWFKDTKTSFPIGYNSLKCELTGLNATDNVKSVDEQKKDANSLWNWVKTLTQIRKDYKLGNATNIKDNGSGGNKIEYTVTGGAGGKGNIKVTILANNNSNVTGNIVTKKVTINGKSCTIAISKA